MLYIVLPSKQGVGVPDAYRHPLGCPHANPGLICIIVWLVPSMDKGTSTSRSWSSHHAGFARGTREATLLLTVTKTLETVFGLSKMPIEVGIAMATPADMEGIATVLLRAMEPEMIDRFMVPFEGFEAAFNTKMEWAKQTYPKDVADLDKRIFKASLKGSSDIVGFGVITYSDGNLGDDRQDASLRKAQDAASDEGKREELTPAFAPFYFGSMSAIHKKHMRGQKHVGECFIPL